MISFLKITVDEPIKQPHFIKLMKALNFDKSNNSVLNLSIFSNILNLDVFLLFSKI